MDEWWGVMVVDNAREKKLSIRPCSLLKLLVFIILDSY